MSAEPEQETCWTLIERAADGHAEDRSTFAQRYSGVIRSYLAARWRATTLAGDIDDALQDVFVELMRDQGALARADRERGTAFRGYLYGVVRNVALRAESKAAKRFAADVEVSAILREIPARDPSTSEVYNRAWAHALIGEAGEILERRAAADGEAAQRRLELLRLRFEEGLKPAEIAEKLGIALKRVHKDYAKVREDFRACLEERVRFHFPGASDEEVTAECTQLLAVT